MSVFRSRRSGGHLWKKVSCSCCGGLEWGGEEPRECSTCFGSGMFYVNRHGTGVLWPGGPFNGGAEALARTVGMAQRMDRDGVAARTGRPSVTLQGTFLTRKLDTPTTSTSPSSGA